MTTQTIERPIQSTCATCPYFQDFGEPNGRGWCQLFDHTARQHHKHTGACEQEIEAVESAQQEPVIPLKLQSAEAGLAGDSVSYKLRSPTGNGVTLLPQQTPQQLAPEPQPTKAETEFEQGRSHGKNDAMAGWHPIYTQPSTEYATGYLSGYNAILNPGAEHPKANKTLEWSVCLDPRWGIYQAWVGDRCIGHSTTHDEGERLAQRYIGVDEMIQRQNRAVMRAYAA